MSLTPTWPATSANVSLVCLSWPVKPVNLMAYLIKIYSPVDSWCLDPFCGSGSTGVAALRENRNFVGIDLSEHYTQIAKQRCASDEVAQDDSNPLENALY